MKKIDVIGKRFNRWTVLSEDDPKKRYLICKCDCGMIKSVYKGNILGGKSKSCGCLSVELTKEREKIHGMSYTPTWNVWLSMLNRAHKYTSSNSHYYKEKGIGVCKEWVESFENFYNDMGEKPEGLTLERINNLKGYSKDNCEWATKSRQASNRGRCTNTSGRLGLFFDKESDKWRVVIKVNKITIHGGRFKNKDDAIQKLNELEIKYFGATREGYV